MARLSLVVDADGDELGEPGAGLVEHAERAVAGVDELGRRLGDAPSTTGRSRSDPTVMTASSSRRSCFGPAAPTTCVGV